MNRHDHDPRLDVAAQLLRAMYPDEGRPGQRIAVLDRIAAANAPAADAPAKVAARALTAAYDVPADGAQRAAVLDAIVFKRAATPLRRRPRMVWPARDTVLALASTVTAALVLGAVILAVRVETAQTPSDPPGGLTAEEQQRLISAAAHRAPGRHAGATVVTPQPTEAPSPTVIPAVHPAIARLQRGCDQGVAVSCLGLGMAYQRGRGVVASQPRALEYYERACRAGDARACARHDMADHRLNDVDRDDRSDAEYLGTLGL